MYFIVKLYKKKKKEGLKINLWIGYHCGKLRLVSGIDYLTEIARKSGFFFFRVQGSY